jgi:hypothetical protein
MTSLVRPHTNRRVSATPPLIGRMVERARVDAWLDAHSSEQNAALVIRGEAGIGKTTILDYAAARAENAELRRVTGIESEMTVPYAALEQLVRPYLDRLHVLPGPQRRARRFSGWPARTTRDGS